MIRKLTLFLIMLFTAAAFAQDLPRIAVYVTGDVSENEKTALGTRMLASLVNSGRYMGIERSESFLAKIDEEHIRQRSGAIDDGQISELGRQFGIKYICIAAITPAFGAFQVSARIIDVETAQVIHIGESNSPLGDMDDFTWVSDEVVHVMFGGEPRERPRSQVAVPQKSRMSVGVGVLFSNDFGGGSGGVAMPYTGGGAYAFFDAIYGKVTVAYSTGGGKWVFDAGMASTDVDMRRSFVCVGVYAKYPEITVNASPQIKMFPLIGIDYEISINNELVTEGHFPPPKTGDLSALWGKVGAGLDFYINADVHLRAEMMYGVRTGNTYEGNDARLGHGITTRIGAGVRF
jgi:hypothetical protein